MSTQETYLQGIADAIREKDGTAEPIQAKSFAARIRAIPVGTGGVGELPPDPEKVYKATRPADWLPMPEPGEDEMYLLVHIPAGTSLPLAFTVTCAESYTVALGTVLAGTFIGRAGEPLASGTKYEAELDADTFGFLTSDGMAQAMVKVTGADILTWAPGAHSKRVGDVTGWNIVEIACRLPHGEAVTCGSADQFKPLKALRYFTWRGGNAAADLSGMFQGCGALVAVPELDTSHASSLAQMFEGCAALTAIAPFDTARASSVKRMFRGCSSLTGIPALDLSGATDVEGLFYNCAALRAVPELDTSNALKMNTVYYGCGALTAIPKFESSKATGRTNLFYACASLASLTLNPDAPGWDFGELSLRNTSLGHDAIVRLFESLPRNTQYALQIDLTYTPGAAELTDGELAIAEGKNWTVTR